MVGNVEDKFHKEVLSGNMGFLNCLNDRPAIKQKYVKIWKILSSARKGFSVKNATKEQLEDTARTCEKLTEVFPVLFPDTNISRKMHCFSIVAPQQIRKQGIVYKMLKIEQAGEVLHKTLNQLDLQFGNEKNVSKKFFKMLRELENSYYV